MEPVAHLPAAPTERGIRPRQGQTGDRLMFIGAYRHSVDAKGRVAIPARFRAQLEDGAVVVCWVEGCAAIFPKAAFEAMAAKFSSQPLANEDARAVTRHLFSTAFELERDAQGRVVLPATIRDWAGLVNEAVIVGAGERVDIWSPEVWASKSLSPEALTSRLSGLSV
jgi:MraZ protein